MSWSTELTLKINSLAIDPRPAGCEKLSGQEKYRLRQGNYRIIYSIQDYELTVWVVKAIDKKLTTEPLKFGDPLSGNLGMFRKLRIRDYRVVYQVIHQDQAT